MSYFVTGTDTGVGKTLISCALLHGFAAQGKRVVGMKPVAAGGSLRGNGVPAGILLAGAAGCNEEGHNEDVLQLRAASNVPVSSGLVNPYCFEAAIAPHLAAQLAGISIDFERIAAAYSELAARTDMVIVEGAGGLLVPLNEKQDTADLARALGLPVILVVGMRLGCLNHALLTVEAIATRGLTLGGWVANVLDEDMAMTGENIAALRERIPAPMLGIVPHLEQPDARTAASFLNLASLEQADLHD